MPKLTVTAEISTKDRYFTTLPMTLVALAQQTVKPNTLLLYDDGEHRDLRQEPSWNSLLSLLTSVGIYWEVAFGERKGQVLNHQKAIDRATTDLIWRVDDDDVPEANVLEQLLTHMDDPSVGAVSGLVWVPGQQNVSHTICSGSISDVWAKPNIQWSDLSTITEVDHLNNTFLFRRSAATHRYCTELSPVGHGEETMFTYGFKRAGYKVLVDPKAKIWHLRNPQGGIRSYTDTALWQHDTEVTARCFRDWGITLNDYKLILLDNGLGDHFAFKSILPELKAKYANKKIQLACCYPEVFEDDLDVDIMSLGEGLLIDGDKDKHNVYKWMWDHNWTNSLANAFREMWL